jgi:hypothetical protein
VGPRTVLDAVMKRKIPSPGRESKSRISIVQIVAQRYTDWASGNVFNNGSKAELARSLYEVAKELL